MSPRRPFAELDNDALVDAIRGSVLDDARTLAAEAGRRGLLAAIPALAAQCRSFAGFGLGRLVPEQAAAIEALERIGGRGAAEALAQLIVKKVVAGPTLQKAVGAIVRLRGRLPSDTVLTLLCHPDPTIRADACGCARSSPAVIATLVTLLDDLNAGVARAAACALARMGRAEGRPPLLRLLREAPCREAIEALPLVADDECVTLLGRIARASSELAEAALEALDHIDLPKAARLAGTIRSGSTAGPARPRREVETDRERR